MARAALVHAADRWARQHLGGEVPVLHVHGRRARLAQHVRCRELPEGTSLVRGVLPHTHHGLERLPTSPRGGRKRVSPRG